MKPATLGFIGVRLREAREARGLTAISLADLVGVSRQAIYQYETGIQSPRPEITEKLAEALKVPISYFRYIDEIETGTIFYRSMSAATKTERLRGESRYKWFRIIIRFLKTYLKFPEINFPRFSIPNNPNNISDDMIEDLAVQARKAWNLSNLPINNMVLLLENHGANIAYDELYADTLDAFSDILQHPDSPAYIILGSDKCNAVRSRFDTAHEYGHKLLHTAIDKSLLNRKPEYSLIEKQAHRFASAFLLPADAFASDFYSSNLDTLINLKPKWKCSIAMMIKRAGDLNFISSEHERRLWINLSRRGWRTREPLDDEIKIEYPQLTRSAFEMLINERIKSKEEILSQIPIPATDIESLAGLKKGYLTETRREELAPMVYLKDYQTNNINTSKPGKDGHAEIKQFRRPNKDN